MTPPNTPRSSKEQREALLSSMLEYHADTFMMLGFDFPRYNFYCKPVFERRGVNCVSLYERELLNSKGFFLEVCDDRYTKPADDARTLYRIQGSKELLKELEMIDEGRYSVPMDRLEIVDVEELKRIHQKPAVPEESFFDEYDDMEDENFSKMTIRDFAAIHWKKPISSKDWLNKLITKTAKF